LENDDDDDTSQPDLVDGGGEAFGNGKKDQEGSDDDDDDNDDDACSGLGDMPPPPLLLENFATPDWYENPQGEPSANYPATSGLPWLPPPSGGLHDLPMQLEEEGQLPASLFGALSPPPAVSLPMAAAVHSLPPAMSARLPLAPPPLYPAPLALRGKAPPPPVPVNDANAEELSRDGAPDVPSIVALPCQHGSGRTRVLWAVDARRLESQDKQAVSHVFEIELPAPRTGKVTEGADENATAAEEAAQVERQAFRLLVHPTPKNDGRRGAGFKKSKGKGRIELKCEAQRPSDASDIIFRMGIGRGEHKQPTRGTVAYNFADGGSCCGLPKSQEEWNFAQAVDSTRTFLVVLEIMGCEALQ
jgi:hypothetical protein